MQWKPNVTVAAVIEHEGRFLLVEENADGADSVVNQPAGHLESGESLLDAVRREVHEETGYAFTPTALIGVYLYPNPRLDIVYLRFCFSGNAAAPIGEVKLDEGIIGTLWLTRDEVGTLGTRLRSDLVTRCIDDYLAGQRHPLDILHHYL